MAEFIEKIRTASGDKQIDYEGLANKPADAPSDGKQYARKDGAWSEVEGGGYEPPADGIPYADLSSDVQESLNKADSALQDADTEEAEQIEIDTVVTENSSNLITSGAVAAAGYLTLATLPKYNGEVE